MSASSQLSKYYSAHPGARCSCADCVKAFPTPEGYCGTRLPFNTRCLRAVTDQCAMCKAYDKHATEWAAVFNEYRSPPRVAVEGDIL